MSHHKSTNTVMRSLSILLLLPITALVLAGCGAVTEIQGSWASADAAGSPLTKIAVFAVGAKSFVSQATIEEALVREYSGRGVTSTAAVNMFKPEQHDADRDGKLDAETQGRVKAKLKEMGFDGVLVVAVKEVTEEERYVPGTVTYTPRSYYNGWYNYWSASYERVETPGYMATDVNAYLECNLYSLTSDDLVWAAQTNTINPQTVQDGAESLAAAIVPNQINKGVVKATTK